MANADTPFGLRPLRHLNGNPWNGQTQKCLIEDSYGTALFIGDPVIITGTAGDDDSGTGKHPVINRFTAGATYRIYGVITSFELIDCAGGVHTEVYNPASTKRYANVCIDPDVVFLVQDDAGATLDGDSVGANAVLSTSTAGSTATGLSGVELAAATTPAADATYQVLILAVHDSPDNEIGAHCLWEVLISNHVLRGGGAASNQGFLGI